MPKWRKFHTKAVESLDINDMPDDFTRLLWVMLPLGLDREGRGLDNPAWVKGKVMLLRTDVTPDMIEGAMLWYAERGMIERYAVNGRNYFWVPSFRSYQGNTIKEAASEYPSPPSDDIPELDESEADNSPELVQSKSGASPELVQSKSSTDVDVDSDVDSDSKNNKRADARDPPSSSGYSDTQKEFLSLFGAKRFKNKVQAIAIGELDCKYGRVKVIELATWAAKTGMNVGKAVVAVESALKKQAGEGGPQTVRVNI